MSESKPHEIANNNARIRALVEKETLNKPLWTEGLVKRRHVSDINHVSFTLSNGDYEMSCIVRNQIARDLAFIPNNGDEVRVHGIVKIYDINARGQIDVQALERVEYSIERDNQDGHPYVTVARSKTPAAPQSWSHSGHLLTQERSTRRCFPLAASVAVAVALYQFVWFALIMQLWN